jgi:hypothetical protein
MHDTLHPGKSIDHDYTIRIKFCIEAECLR